jgi:8-oxo-dGTP diphosphatase
VTTELDEIWARASKGIAAAAVILDAHRRVLLVKHSYGRPKWEIPGGAAERNETPTQTALREVLEETGLTVTANRLTGVYYEHHGPGREALHFVFLCRLVDETAVAFPACDEITACSYWSTDALPRPLSDFTLRRIHDAFAEPGPVLPVAITPRQWLQ